MNASIKSMINPQSSFFHIKSAFFHSTTFLQRGRRSNWNSRHNNSNNNRWSGHRRNQFKRNLMRDPNAYVEYLFQSWQSDFDQDEQPFSRGPSWFRKPQNGSGRNHSNTQEPQNGFGKNHGFGKHHSNAQGRQKSGKRGYSFCDDDDDDDVETIFRSAFGDRFFFWSFVNEDYPHWKSSSRFSKSYKTSWKRRHQYEYEDDDEEDYTSAATRESDLASERKALGLSASGPLKLEEVKNAYRTCALKWHPDRHLGSSKADAEEKFKLCTAAYQSLCDRLTMI